MKKVFIACLTVIVAGCAAAWAQTQIQTQPAAQEPQAAGEAFARAYKIGPGDLLEIKVFELDQLNQTVRVSEDGSVALPLVGRIEVEGLTLDGVVQKLTTLLQAKFVKNPQVTIFIKEYKSKQVAVIGAVEKPGSYELVGPKNLLQVLAMAGGITDKSTNEIFVLRNDGTGEDTTTIPIDLQDLMLNGNPKLNILIEPNDVVNVPMDREIKVFVMGRVTQPGALTFKISERVSLLKAIAQAGGLAEGAKQSAVMITRRTKDGREQKIQVNLKDVQSGKKKDIMLQEGDVVFVPESFW